MRLSDDSCVVRQEWLAGASIKQLVDKCLDQKTPADKPDYYQVIHVELSDRVKASAEACADLAKEILKHLSNIDHSVRVQ